jgi:hypothetical protein
VTESRSDARRGTEPTESEPPERLGNAVPRPRRTRFVSWTDLARVADEAADIDTIVQEELQSLRRQGLLDESPAVERGEAPRPGRRRRRRVGTVVSLIIAAGVAAAVIPRVIGGHDAVTPPSLASPSAAAGASTTPPSPSQTPAPVVTVIRARLVVSAPCWVRAITDGHVVFAGTLESGTRAFHARDSLLLRLGNAGGVRLVVNGRTVATGSAGEVVDLSFALRHGEVVES